MDIYFYNTLTKKKELFKTIEPQKVKMYSCGPTVYKDATIGNMRTNLFQDTLRRVLEYNGYEVKQVMNITEKQYSQIEFIIGSNNSKIINSEERLIVL